MAISDFQPDDGLNTEEAAELANVLPPTLEEAYAMTATAVDALGLMARAYLLGPVPPGHEPASCDGCPQQAVEQRSNAELLVAAPELLAALRQLHGALRERHHGRMPEDVQQAYDKAGALLGRFGAA